MTSPATRGGKFEFVPTAMGGWVIGVIAILFLITVCMVGFVSLQQMTGTGTGAGWPQWAVALTGIASAILAVLVGWWLVRLRHWIGATADEAEADRMRRKRRYFTVGAIASYVPLALAFCLLMIAFANST
jgi:hypothetical protein